jgi:RNA polymerase sigma-70 factor (ECF subfamily)
MSRLGPVAAAAARPAVPFRASLVGVPESPPSSQAEERRLVARMRAGEAAAFEEFAAGYLPGLYRFALRRLGPDRELVRDLVQATACKAIERLASYRGEAPLFTWLCACCRNEIGMHFRRRDRRPREAELDEATASDAPRGGAGASVSAGPEERLLRLEVAELVHAALDRLPPAYARAVEWRYLEELPVPEIARRLESSYKATESLLSRARKAFRQAYERLAQGAQLPEVPAGSAELGGKP